MVTPGGRIREQESAPGAVTVGVRTLSEAGSVGGFSREQVELFCVSNLISCVLDCDEEFLCMDFHFTLREGGMLAAFQLVHMVLEKSVWQEDALDRARQIFVSYHRGLPKSLERATAFRLMTVMFGKDARFMDPEPADLKRLTLEGVREAVLRQLLSGNLEVTPWPLPFFGVDLFICGFFFFFFFFFFFSFFL